MPNWKVWPSPPSRVHNLRLELVVCDVAGLPLDGMEDVRGSTAMVLVQWRGGGRRPGIGRRAVERSCTGLQRIRSDGAVSWREGFQHECKLKAVDPQKGFKSWIVKLEIHGFGPISKFSSSILGKTQLDVSGFACLGEEISVRIPIECSIRGFSAEAELGVTLRFSDPHVKSGAASTITRAQSLRGFSYSAFPQTDGGHVWDSRTSAEPGRAGRHSGSSANEPARSSSAGLPSEEENRHFPRRFSRTHSLRRLLSWGRRQLGFGPPKHPVGGPPPREASGDGGGDRIDHGSPSTLGAQEEHPVLGFEGDGQFEIGSWEEKTLASRDGRLELVTEVFLASIDQRSEKAAGESACSVLAAVIADWLHRNAGVLPLRCQFDELVREGSAEWRRLCADARHVERFSDRHFDLDTVLGARVRPLAVATGMSYVGFFGLEGAAPEGFEYLQGAMSFDGVWEELLRSVGAGEERVYIAGWNDHFFVLKVEKEAVYLVDTLGERLSEGCTQAYILKFDKESRVYSIDEREPTSTEGGEQKQCSSSESTNHDREGGKEKVEGGGSTSRSVVCEGLAACKEFIKGFLAAVPLRELLGDMERGLAGDAHLHRLLQIEFHYTFPL